jgi:hypothetical protein
MVSSVYILDFSVVLFEMGSSCVQISLLKF